MNLFCFLVAISLLVMDSIQDREDPSLRIVEGNIASGDMYIPFMASIQINGTHTCGGSILSSIWILTAAHCFFDLNDKPVPAEHVKISVGNTHWKRGVPFKASKVITHEDYDDHTFEADIALVQLKTPIYLNKKIQPVVLDPVELDENHHYLVATVSGWGNFVEDGFLSVDVSDYLRTVHVTVVPRNICEEEFEDASTEFKICVQSTNETGTCVGDSGGPLVMNGKQIGIVSSGFDCPSESFELYTRISSFYNWIFGKVLENKPDPYPADAYQRIYSKYNQV